MRRRGAALVTGVAVLVGAAMLWSGLQTEPEPPRRVARKAKRPRVQRFPVKQAPPVAADAEMAQAARGAYGPELQERVCDLCAFGMLDDASCEACEPESEPSGVLVVDLIDEDGRPAERGRIAVRGCQVLGRETGLFTVTPGSCVVSAFRRDGALWARSERVEVEVPEGGEAYAQVVLKNARTGGLGVSIGKHPDGVRVMAVMPGTPAAEVGIEAGDVIVEVDGVPTAELDLQEFISTMTGPEQTEVDFVVQFETDTGLAEEAVSIVRRFLEPSG